MVRIGKDNVLSQVEGKREKERESMEDTRSLGSAWHGAVALVGAGAG